MTGEHTNEGTLLSVQGLSVSFLTAHGWVSVVRDLSFSLERRQTLSLVGESGCGKTVSALSILRLLPRRNARIDGGRILFEGRDLLSLPEGEMKIIRGNRIAMIFQEPMTSLNPVLTVGRQIHEVLVRHKKLSRAEARRQTIELLERVRIPDGARRLNDYPHQMSGGMRQRVMIAMALACRPSLLIADEPTTALDVTIQAQILALLQELRDEFNTALLLITHDLGVVAEVAERVVVLYAGSRMEEASTIDLFKRPRHPYTVGLLASKPKLSTGATSRPERLLEIPGTVPSPTDWVEGCAFHPRCGRALVSCAQLRPPMTRDRTGHVFACWNPVPTEGAMS